MRYFWDILQHTYWNIRTGTFVPTMSCLFLHRRCLLNVYVIWNICRKDCVIFRRIVPRVMIILARATRLSLVTPSHSGFDGVASEALFSKTIKLIKAAVHVEARVRTSVPMKANVTTIVSLYFHIFCIEVNLKAEDISTGLPFDQNCCCSWFGP